MTTSLFFSNIVDAYVMDSSINSNISNMWTHEDVVEWGINSGNPEVIGFILENGLNGAALKHIDIAVLSYLSLDARNILESLKNTLCSDYADETENEDDPANDDDSAHILKLLETASDTLQKMKSEMPLVRRVGWWYSSCGYCNVDKNKLYGLKGSFLPPLLLEELLQKGWGRSGTLLYKPDQNNNCCVHYNIRLPISDFVPKKSQRRVWNKTHPLLHSIVDTSMSMSHGSNGTNENDNTVNEGTNSNTLTTSTTAEGTTCTTSISHKDVNNDKCSNDNNDKIHLSVDDIRDIKIEKSSIKIKIVRSRFDQDSYDLWVRYQKAVHGDTEEQSSVNSYMGFLVNTPISYERIPDNCRDYFDVKYYGSYHLKYYWKDILIAVAVMDILPNVLHSVYFFWDRSFKKFSLGIYSALLEINVLKYGIENRMVRDGNEKNIDKEVSCDNYSSLSTLRKPAYYFLGWYIHTCPKMNYKSTFSTSQLQCPYTDQWVEFNSEKRRLLDEMGCARLADKEVAIPKKPSVNKMGIIPCYYLGKRGYYQNFSEEISVDKWDRMEEYMYLVGELSATKMTYALK